MVCKKECQATLRWRPCQNGSRSFFHWFTTLDGVQHPEFTRGNGSTSTTTIALKKIDDHSFEIKGITIASGKTHLTGTGVISAATLPAGTTRTLGLSVANVSSFGEDGCGRASRARRG